MRKEKKKLTYGPRDIGVSWAFFFFFAPCRPLTATCVVVLRPPSNPVPVSTLRTVVHSRVLWWWCRHSSFVFYHLRFRPPCPCLLFVVRRSPFHCPLSLAASTCNPPHEQWLAGLGWVLAIRRCSSITHPPCKQWWVLLVPSWVVSGVGVPS